jgi:hypothetical protein
VPPPAPRYPGLTKATLEESALLRAAIIEALGGIGGDHAGRALKTLADLERRRNNDDMAAHFIAAFANCKASNSVRSLCDLYMEKAGPHTVAAIAALAHIGALDPDRATTALRRLAENGTVPPDVAAAAMDAQEEIPSAGGT